MKGTVVLEGEGQSGFPPKTLSTTIWIGSNAWRVHSRLLVVLVVANLLVFLLNGLGICSYESVATNEEDCRLATNEEDCRLGRRRPVRIPLTDFVHDDMD